MYISGDSSSLYNSIKLIQPRETEILNPLTFSYSTSPFSLYMHIHPVPSERKEKKKRITTTTIRVCQTVGLKLMCLSLCGGFHIEKIRWWRVFLLFYSRLPVAHSRPISPPPSIPLTLAELTHTHLDSAFADAAWLLGASEAAAQHPLLNQVVMGMVAGGVRDIFIYICVPAAFRSPYSWW